MIGSAEPERPHASQMAGTSPLRGSSPVGLLATIVGHLTPAGVRVWCTSTAGPKPGRGSRGLRVGGFTATESAGNCSLRLVFDALGVALLLECLAGLLAGGALWGLVGHRGTSCCCRLLGDAGARRLVTGARRFIVAGLAAQERASGRESASKVVKGCQTSWHEKVAGRNVGHRRPNPTAPTA